MYICRLYHWSLGQGCTDIKRFSTRVNNLTQVIEWTVTTKGGMSDETIFTAKYTKSIETKSKHRLPSGKDVMALPRPMSTTIKPTYIRS